jgi:hypothetical protein
MHVLRILVLVLILSFPFLAKSIDKRVTVRCVVRLVHVAFLMIAFLAASIFFIAFSNIVVDSKVFLCWVT